MTKRVLDATYPPLPEVQGDPVLAKFFSDNKIEPKPSRILRTDHLAMAFNFDRLNRVGEDYRRVAVLSCRHTVITTNSTRVVCPRCREMYRHGMDMEAFLRDEVPDELIWRDDPCRLLNEKTDLAGNFIDDCYAGADRDDGRPDVGEQEG